MQCMKCGQETGPEQVFCETCLADMEKHPVKPGTVVLLPHRPAQQQVKKQPQRRKPTVPLEDQVKLLRKYARILACGLVLAIAALIGMVYLAVDQYMEDDGKFLPGQNYSSISSTTTPTETP